jgi:hypothetical protein
MIAQNKPIRKRSGLFLDLHSPATTGSCSQTADEVLVSSFPAQFDCVLFVEHDHASENQTTHKGVLTEGSLLFLFW